MVANVPVELSMGCDFFGTHVTMPVSHFIENFSIFLLQNSSGENIKSG